MGRTKLFALEEDVVKAAIDESEIDKSGYEFNSTVTDTVNEIDSIDTYVETVRTGFKAVDELNDVKSTMEISITQGDGLTTVAAEMVRISLKNILNNIGAENYISKLLISTEDYGSKTTRLNSTKYVAESIGKFVIDILIKIKDFFVGLYNKIKDFIMNLFMKEKVIRNHIEKITTQIESLKAMKLKPHNRVISIKAIDKILFLKFLTYKKSYSESEVVALVEKHYHLINEMGDLIKNGRESSNVFNALMEESNNTIRFSDLNIHKQIGPLFDGSSISYQEHSVFLKNIKVITDVSINDFKVDKRSDHEINVSTDLRDYVDLLNKVKEIIDGRFSSKKEGKEVVRDMENNLKILNKAINILKKDKKEGRDIENLKEIAQMFNRSVAAINTLYPYLIKINFKLAQSIIQYIQLGLMEYTNDSLNDSLNEKVTEVNSSTQSSFTGYRPSKSMELSIMEMDLMGIRIGLSLEFSNRRLDGAALRAALRWTKAQVPNLCETYVEKDFSGPMDQNKDHWTSNYFFIQMVYLKTSFTEERFLHMVDVRDCLRERGEEGFAPVRKQDN